MTTSQYNGRMMLTLHEAVDFVFDQYQACSVCKELTRDVAPGCCTPICESCHAECVLPYDASDPDKGEIRAHCAECAEYLEGLWEPE